MFTGQWGSGFFWWFFFAFQGGSFDTGKQLSKFLGPPGPSDRLLHTLDLMSELVERSQHETLAEEVHEWKQLIYGLWLAMDAMQMAKWVWPCSDSSDLLASRRFHCISLLLYLRSSQFYERIYCTYKCSKCQTLLDAGTYWALPIYFVDRVSI